MNGQGDARRRLDRRSFVAASMGAAALAITEGRAGRLTRGAGSPPEEAAKRPVVGVLDPQEGLMAAAGVGMVDVVSQRNARLADRPFSSVGSRRSRSGRAVRVDSGTRMPRDSVPRCRARPIGPGPSASLNEPAPVVWNP
jgi:hypothetical protein